MERPYLLRTWQWVGLLICQIILSAIEIEHSPNIYWVSFVVIVSAIIYCNFINIIRRSYLYDKHFKIKPVKKRKTK